MPKKAKFFFSTAVQKWDAEFYVKVDDSINLDLGTTSIQDQNPTYSSELFIHH